jgi:hypothetical protein
MILPLDNSKTKLKQEKTTTKPLSNSNQATNVSKSNELERVKNTSPSLQTTDRSINNLNF